MSLRYIDRYEKDQEYYILNNYNTDNLIKIHTELEEAKETIKELQKLIEAQYQQATRTTYKTRIAAQREKSDYSQDKKVKIVIRVYKDQLLNNEVVHTDIEYNKTKYFSYQDKVEAMLYVYDLLSEYPGSIYYNLTGYKGIMEI